MKAILLVGWLLSSAGASLFGIAFGPIAGIGLWLMASGAFVGLYSVMPHPLPAPEPVWQDTELYQPSSASVAVERLKSLSPRVHTDAVERFLAGTVGDRRRLSS